MSVGVSDGAPVGNAFGTVVGSLVGYCGMFVGNGVETFVGSLVGDCGISVGVSDGAPVGTSVGIVEGCPVGDPDGSDPVGTAVGGLVHPAICKTVTPND